MQLNDDICTALRYIRAYKLRSTLTLLGILVGAATIVALIANGQMATRHALAQFKTLGPDLFAVTIIDNSHATAQNMTLSQVEQLSANQPAIVLTAPFIQRFISLAYANQPIDGQLIGTTSVFQLLLGIEIVQGRFLSALDHGEYYCVIGANIAKQLGQIDLNLLNKQLRVGQRYCTIIGVAAAKPQSFFLNFDVNQAIIIPINTALSMSANGGGGVGNILFKLREHTDIDQFTQQMQKQIQQMFPNSKPFLRSAKQLLQSLTAQQTTFNLMLSVIASIALLAGGIGVMNIMLAVVMERRREIGIRRAVGATQYDIQCLFLTEAVLLALLGGGFGIGIGILVSWLVALGSHWDFYLGWLPILLGLAASAVTGIFFGYYPARQAARLEPIEALRAE